MTEDGLLAADAADAADSVAVHQLSHFNEDKLKRLFLDRSAELVANVKNVRYVAASLMVEWPDRVDVFVSRNEGINEGDSDGESLKTLELRLRTIAREGSAADDAIGDLWGALVPFYSSRVTEYIDAVQRSLAGLNIGAGDISSREEGHPLQDPIPYIRGLGPDGRPRIPIDTNARKDNQNFPAD